MKLKSKKVYVWCKKTPTMISGCSGTGWALGKRIRNKVVGSNKVSKLPKKVICPDCKKKFKPRIRECFDPGCWHVYVPAHKKIIKKTSRN